MGVTEGVAEVDGFRVDETLTDDICRPHNIHTVDSIDGYVRQREIVSFLCTTEEAYLRR